MKTTFAKRAAAPHAVRCVHWGALSAKAEARFGCSECSELLEVIYPEWTGAPREFGLRLKETWQARKDSSLGENSSGVWRFRELLPQIERSNIVTLGEGNTPLLPIEKTCRFLRLGSLLAKHQGMNPTGSFKDTGISVAISMAKTTGFKCVCCASTGNTSASVAAFAARTGMKSIVLLPAGQGAFGKLAPTLEYCAHMLELRTHFDGCLSVLKQVVERLPAYLPNSVKPYRLEGHKTVAI